MREMFKTVYMLLLGEELMIYNIEEKGKKRSCSSIVAKLLKTEQSGHVKLQLL